IAIVTSVAQGICGTIFIVTNYRWKLLLVVTSSARHLHIALDTVVLYDVLGGPSGSMDERVPGRSSDEVATAASNASLRQTPEENDTGSPRHKIGRRFAMNV
ncbi:unnamed protein product, partial [Sphacelaria rigidula]